MKKDSEAVRIKSMQTLAKQWGKLALVTFEQRTRRGEWRERKREIYDNGNSATILPYDAERKTVLLTRQLRLPMYLQDDLERTLEQAAAMIAAGEIVDAKTVILVQFLRERVGG